MTMPFNQPPALAGRVTRIHRWLLAVGLFVVVLSAGYYWLFGDGGALAGAEYSFDVNMVRKAAASITGARATDIQVETISHRLVPETD